MSLVPSLLEYKQGEFVHLAAVKDHPATPPKVDEVVFQTFQNQDALVQALVTGQVDMITEMPTTAVPTLRNAKDVKLVIGAPLSPDLTDIILNQTAPENCPPGDGQCTGHPALRDLVVRGRRWRMPPISRRSSTSCCWGWRARSHPHPRRPWRVGWAILTIVFVIVLNFFLFRVLPGDPARAGIRDPRLTAQAQQAIRVRFGLDKPVDQLLHLAQPAQTGPLPGQPFGDPVLHLRRATCCAASWASATTATGR